MRVCLVRCLGLALSLGCASETPSLQGGAAAAAGSGGSGVVAGSGGASVSGSGGTSPESGTGGIAAGSGGASAGVGGVPASGGVGAGGNAGAGAIGGQAGSPARPLSRAEERAEIDAKLAGLAELDAATLRTRYPVTFEPAPTYVASEIAGLDTIQGSSLALNDAELTALGQKGFVIRGTSTFPSFAYGYHTIYAQDLPVYVSADSILDSVHRSYDSILKEVEISLLSGKLTTLLEGMRARLQSGAGAELGDAARADADTFLAVALSLLSGAKVAPVAGGAAADIGSLVDLALAASGPATVNLFGVSRMNEDFSQFKPRGHYMDTLALGQYFRAMMWLGRIDFRLIETESNGHRVFRRRQLDGMLLMHALIDSELRPHFDEVDHAIRLFVGDPDYMELSEVGALLADVGATGLAGVAGISDQVFEQAILAGGYGLQRIASHVMVNGLADPGTLPLNVSFALLGQRYVIDSHVFSNVVFDRVGGGNVKRMMPNPLDVAFAVLENNQAATLLAPELERYPYAPDLAAMRVLSDAHPPEFWGGTLYNLWLGSLRELGPDAIARSADADALTPTFRSEAWGRRLLTTQLASWAQLRHDTILYAKQSYTGAGLCEFPDGYVDPYPAFYERLREYAARGQAAFGTLTTGPLPVIGQSIGAYFDNLHLVVTRLRDMAQHQRTGAPYTQEMLDFLNDAVIAGGGCGTNSVRSGWYKRLFFSLTGSADRDPTIADVHTQPTDEVGASVGKVLHVATGDPRLMVVVAETCSGPRAYAGLASSYYEYVTSNYERVTDEDWAGIMNEMPDVPWAADLVTR